MEPPRILGSDALDLGRLRELVQRPSLFAPHLAPFWDDPHIAKQMLAAHLDPEWNAASRPHAAIDREVQWMLSQLDVAPGQRVLDLGCGPGLYCARFAARQLGVTGVDLSPLAIDYASRHARDHGLAIEYHCQDYRALEYADAFDGDVQQTVVVDEDGTARVYRIWNRGYTVDSITALLAAHGFQVDDFWGDLTGTPYDETSKVLGVIASKPSGRPSPPSTAFSAPPW